MTPSTKHKFNLPIFRNFFLRNFLSKSFLIITAIIIYCCSIFSSSHSQADENIVKAVFFERFSRFIEWKKVSNNDEFKIIIIGSDIRMLNHLKKVYGNHTIKDKSVVIQHIENVSDLKKTDCDILFISENMSKNLDQIIEYSSQKSILTIADSKNFAKRGVMINFFLKDSSVQFKINQEAAKKANIFISYHLLKMAEVVEGS